MKTALIINLAIGLLAGCGLWLLSPSGNAAPPSDAFRCQPAQGVEGWQRCENSEALCVGPIQSPSCIFKH